MADEGPFERAVELLRAGDATGLERWLAATPALVEAKDTDGQTLLGVACKLVTGDVARPAVRGTAEQHAALQVLLRSGADASATTPQGWAPLHTAAMSGHAELARLLLAAGASPEGHLHGTAGGSPLAMALFYGEREVAELLADPPLPDNLRTAAALGRPLERFFVGADPASGDAAGDDPLRAELTPQATEGCDFYGLGPPSPEWTRIRSRQEVLDEALGWAARNERVDILEQLMARGAAVNANPHRGTALLWACAWDAVEAATWLLDHGADPNLRHDFGGDGHGVQAVAMHLAAQYGSLRCLRLLLERGADTTIEDAAFEATPLQWATHVGSLEAAEILRAHAAG